MTGGRGSHTLIRAGRLIDGLGGPPIERAAILVQDSKIVAVGPERNVSAPEGVPVKNLNYSDKTVMPGMVDCHTHHNGFGDGRAGDDLATLPDEILVLQSARNARTSLLTGVTTFRENGPKNVTMLRLRDAIREGREIGPRMVLCGRPVAIIGGHMDYMGSVATGPVATRAMVRQLVKEGADYIKITATGGSTRTSDPMLPSFNVDELSAAVDEAHKFGKLTATHSSSTQGIINSLDAGVDMIIHCIFKDADGTDRFREDVAERIGNRGAFVNPTLHVPRSTVWALEHKKADTGLTGAEQVKLDDQSRQFEGRMEDARRLIDMGLKVITGSDSSWGDYQLGNTMYETECLVMAGLSPMQGVLSVTSEAAKALGVDDEVGTLEPGKQADVIAVRGNPDEDLNALWDVTDVMLAGKLVERGSTGPIAATRQHVPHSHK
jgi:imidazolonepropionase-like amidohydrolase